MTKTAVSYASGRFRPGLKRLIATLERVGAPCFWHSEERSGQDGKFTPHEDIPYFFKVEMMELASRTADVLLWLDSSIFATGAGPLDPLFEHIEKHGHLFLHNGWQNSLWCNDRSLEAFNFTRDEAESQPSVMGGAFGLSTSHPMGKDLLKMLRTHKLLFRGRYSNETRSESADPRCLGHRHDQSVMSLIAARHGYDVMKGGAKWICYDKRPDYLLNIDGSPNG